MSGVPFRPLYNGLLALRASRGLETNFYSLCFLSRPPKMSSWCFSSGVYYLAPLKSLAALEWYFCLYFALHLSLHLLHLSVPKSVLSSKASTESISFAITTVVHVFLFFVKFVFFSFKTVWSGLFGAVLPFHLEDSLSPVNFWEVCNHKHVFLFVVHLSSLSFKRCTVPCELLRGHIRACIGSSRSGNILLRFSKGGLLGIFCKGFIFLTFHAAIAIGLPWKFRVNIILNLLDDKYLLWWKVNMQKHDWSHQIHL